MKTIQQPKDELQRKKKPFKRYVVYEKFMGYRISENIIPVKHSDHSFIISKMSSDLCTHS